MLDVPCNRETSRLDVLAIQRSRTTFKECNGQRGEKFLERVERVERVQERAQEKAKERAQERVKERVERTYRVERLERGVVAAPLCTHIFLCGGAVHF